MAATTQLVWTVRGPHPHLSFAWSSSLQFNRANLSGGHCYFPRSKFEEKLDVRLARLRRQESGRLRKTVRALDYEHSNEDNDTDTQIHTVHELEDGSLLFRFEEVVAISENSKPRVDIATPAADFRAQQKKDFVKRLPMRNSRFRRAIHERVTEAKGPPEPLATSPKTTHPKRVSSEFQKKSPINKMKSLQASSKKVAPKEDPKIIETPSVAYLHLPKRPLSKFTKVSPLKSGEFRMGKMQENFDVAKASGDARELAGVTPEAPTLRKKLHSSFQKQSPVRKHSKAKAAGRRFEKQEAKSGSELSDSEATLPVSSDTKTKRRRRPRPRKQTAKKTWSPEQEVSIPQNSSTTSEVLDLSPISLPPRLPSKFLHRRPYRIIPSLAPRSQSTEIGITHLSIADNAASEVRGSKKPLKRKKRLQALKEEKAKQPPAEPTVSSTSEPESVAETHPVIKGEHSEISDLEVMSVSDLRERAKNLKIKGYWKMKKAELVEALR